MKKLIQISDCHIDDDKLAMGADTQLNLERIIAEIAKLSFDALLITGDLTHNGTLSAYQRLKELLTPIKQPVYVFGGNHDQSEHLSDVFADNLFDTITLGNWTVVDIDSVQPDKTSGRVTQAALNTLDKQLDNTHSEYVMLALHHPVVSMNSSWDDSLSLENPQELFQTLDKHSKIRSIIFGHAHEAAEFTRDKLDIISCPSTALQFTHEPRIGFNIYNLHTNGTLDWQTQWI
ncbi:MAG: metallophosphoesterase [Candidatus Thioglobus sp.]|uniref:metallophosphoesterase family protein n=1 Tax=Candidatus Thioglobus sp. TaxID=2026721 RepID=UPI00262AF749|nr:metallophosphoesterase [Candidatus Thioglobus sp.]MDC9726635.1 metallophosphoesterase [Candidatus Thioglobus sp.]